MPIPLKEKVKNYDNLLTGKLINFVENPDSLGYADGRWYSPKYDRRYKSGAFDPANFGIGIDRNSNEYVDNGELMFHKDSKGREYLTETEERNVRNHSIANAEKSYAKRLSHAQETLHSNNIPSEIKKAITISAIYNLGQGYVANNLFEDNVLMDAFLNGSDLEYSNQVNRYYEKKRKGDRGIKTNRFIEQLQQEPVTTPNTIQGGGIRAEGGSLNSPKLWDDLSMTERAEMMRVAVNNGITDLPTIRQKYNEFAEGGPKRDYNTWKKLIHDYKGLDVDNDNTYDYLSYYNNHTDEAWDMLNNAPDAHFYDTYKTAYHPTFSDESVYSGRYDLLHNPRGVVGGRWLENPNRFIPSPSKRNIDSIRETADYISVAEPNGLQIRDEQGRWPIINGTVFGGVLPQVDVSPNLYPDGGPLVVDDVPDDYTYYVGSLPAVTVSAHALPAYQDQFTGQWYGIGPGGRKINKPANFDPSGARVYTSPEAFERARLNRAYADDLNHYGEFGDMVRGLATDLVMAPAGDVVAEPLGLLGNRIIKSVPKINRNPFENNIWFSEQVRKLNPIDNWINDGLEAAYRYKTSPQYQSLVDAAQREAQSLGFGNIAKDNFKPVVDRPKVIFELRDKGSVAGYRPKSNTLSMDFTQSFPEETPFHEGIHWQRVGTLTDEPTIEPVTKAYQRGDFQEANNLLKDFYKTEDEREALEKYYKYKIDNVLQENARDYIRELGELPAHGIETGRAIGIKPFSPLPQNPNELTGIIDDAIQYNSILSDVKNSSIKDRENFWKILTGNYIPASLPVIFNLPQRKK